MAISAETKYAIILIVFLLVYPNMIGMNVILTMGSVVLGAAVANILVEIVNRLWKSMAKRSRG